MARYPLDGSGWEITGWYRNQWKFTRSMELDKMLVPAVATFTGAFPGSIQANLQRRGVLEDPRIGLDSLKAEWVNNREWFCDRRFSIPGEISPETRIFLRLLGLDTEGEIYFDSELIGSFETPLVPVELEISGKIEPGRDHLLRIVFHQTPEVDGQYGFTGRIRRFVSRFGYIWDWCPRMPQTGIWDSALVETTGLIRITSCRPLTEETADGWRVAIRTELDSVAAAPGVRLSYTLADPQGRPVASGEETRAVEAGRSEAEFLLAVPAPELWYPAGTGAASLYSLEVRILDGAGRESHSWRGRIGFRRVEMVRNPGAPETALPYTLRINGRELFLKGVNWVPPTAYFGDADPAEYRRLLTTFQEMGCNLIRVWGGAVLEKECFYDICDELGLMVWQEFPQSSSGMDNLPSEDREYVEPLTRVAESYLKRRARHPSLIIWCGGNELMYPDYRPIGEEHTAIEALARSVRSLTPDRIFLPASASGPRFCASGHEFGGGVHHDVHGPWLFGGVEEHFTFFNGDDSLLRSETGCPGASRPALIAEFSGECSVWPPDETNPYWTHRGSWWLQFEELTGLFGPWREEEFAQYCAASRFIQAAALAYAAEATLSRSPAASGFIVWMGNEPFPNNANTSVLEFDGRPKPAWYALRRAFDETIPTASFERIVWETGEEFGAELRTPDCSWELRGASGDLLARGNGALIRAAVPDRPFFLRLQGKEGARRTYPFSVASRRDGEWERPLASLRELSVDGVTADPTVREGVRGFLVRNGGSLTAVGVTLGLPEGSPRGLLFTRGDEILFPGEELFFGLTATAPEEFEPPQQAVIEVLNCRKS